jgi:hypothetical protein
LQLALVIIRKDGNALRNPKVIAAKSAFPMFGTSQSPAYAAGVELWPCLTLAEELDPRQTSLILTIMYYIFLDGKCSLPRI